LYDFLGIQNADILVIIVIASPPNGGRNKSSESMQQCNGYISLTTNFNTEDGDSTVSETSVYNHQTTPRKNPDFYWARFGVTGTGRPLSQRGWQSLGIKAVTVLFHVWTHLHRELMSRNTSCHMNALCNLQYSIQWVVPKYSKH
jgi:hypothetical protein